MPILATQPTKIMKTTVEYACLFATIAALAATVMLDDGEGTIDNDYDGIEMSSFVFPNIFQYM
jgi:hypothetical protein